MVQKNSMAKTQKRFSSPRTQSSWKSVFFEFPELECQELREELPLPVIAPLLGLGLLGNFLQGLGGDEVRHEK